MLRYFVLISLLMAPTSEAEGEQAARTSIAGEVTPLSRGTVRLLRVDRKRYQHVEIETTEIDRGGFEFEFEQTSPAIYRLQFPKGRRLELAVRPGQRVVLQHNTQSKETTVSGSPDSTDFMGGLEFDREFQRGRLAPARAALKHAIEKRDQGEVIDQRRSLEELKREWFASYVEFLGALESPLAIYGLFTLYDWNYQIGDYDLEPMEGVVASLKPQLPGDGTIIADLREVVERYRATAIGEVFPDYPFPGIDGQPRRVSDLRGKHVLVEIWASWCAPCRKESPNLVANYHRYREDGFEIFSFSFDDDRSRWLKAIKKDKMVWANHVSDLAGKNSEATYLYNTAPPSNFLLDPNGRVVAKNLVGDALERALFEIFGH